MNHNCKCNEDESGERNIAEKINRKMQLSYELNGLEYLIQIFQMSYDFCQVKFALFQTRENS